MTAAIDRRFMLKGFAATVALAATPDALAAPRRRFFERIGKPIGLQLYTLGDDPTKDLDGTLARVAQIGFRDLELPSLLGKTPQALRAAADRAGLRFSSIHVGQMPGMPANMLSFASPAQQVADTLGPLGISSMVLPILPFPANFQRREGEDFRAMFIRGIAEGGPDHWKRVADLLNERATALRPYGITVGYHNHNVEFAPVGDSTGWDLLVAATDPALVFFEIDLGWVTAAGHDPVAFLARHKGRVRWVHVKDVKASTKTNFAMGMDPAEVGYGKLDWQRVLPAALDAGAQHFYLEQEPPFTMARIDAAAKGFGYLKALRA
ncbi:MAG: sugar phosphate isomerase/epimerase [Sphingomonadales bacterium]|nr:sugar phosphate isomerase/epimerase [Sphingomonadales bacterium]